MRTKRTNKYIILIWLLFTFVCNIVFACTNCGGNGCSNASVSFTIPRATITADTLQNLIKSKTPITIIECRSPEQKKDLHIPDALIVADNSTAENLKPILPATDSLIILYPGLEGGKVASISNILKSLGYISILEYNSGIHGWITYGYEAIGENK